jgi:hypothetical protein
MRRSLLALALLPVISFAADDPTHTTTAYKMETPPTIDGVINADEWKGCQMMEGLYDATDQSPCPEKLNFWIGYDDKYIYFAAHCFDSQPKAIKMTEYRTNASVQGDDFVQLDVDTYGTMTDWNHFYINPRGATDLQIAGGRAAKREWVGDFTAKSQVVEDGWVAEARIPWQLMKLPAAGTRNVRFDVDRKIARLSRYFDWTRINGQDFSGTGKWVGVQMPKGDDEKILQLLPYSYQGYAPNGAVANGGLDVKFPLTDQMTLVGTANPDFRNVENQILSIDFSRFERLAGESRPFFQEGADYYGSALVATQRIKAFDTGINVYGKTNDRMSLGVLNTSDFGHENDFVTTMQYSLNPVSQLRFSHSSLDSQNLKNRGYLLAYNTQMGYVNVFARGMSTQDATNGKGEERVLNLNYNHGELNGNIGYEQVSPNYLPRLGFQPEVDFKGITGSIGLDKVYKKGTIAEVFMGTYGTRYDHFGGGDYRRGQGGDFNIASRDGTRLAMNADFSQFEGVNDHTYTAALVRPRNDPYRFWRVGYTWGQIEQHTYRSVNFGMAYRPMNNFQLNLAAQFVDHFSHDKQLIMSGNYDLGNDKSISGRLVQGSKDLNAYFAFRKSGNAGTEYFLIFGDPNASRFRSSLLLKVTYPLQMFLGHHGK